MQAQEQAGFLQSLNDCPHGVINWSPTIEALVETSTNLAIIHTHAKQAEIICSTRSSVASALEATRNMLEAVCQLSGARINQPEGYPGWMPNLESQLLKTLKKVYKKKYKKEPKVGAIHAGLECGIIGEKFTGMDMISFGPTIQGAHSPDEKVHIKSIENTWYYLLELLKRL